jgi:hypothetical protein
MNFRGIVLRFKGIVSPDQLASPAFAIEQLIPRVTGQQSRDSYHSCSAGKLDGIHIDRLQGSSQYEIRQRLGMSSSSSLAPFWESYPRLTARLGKSAICDDKGALVHVRAMVTSAKPNISHDIKSTHPHLERKLDCGSTLLAAGRFHDVQFEGLRPPENIVRRRCERIGGAR